MEDGAGLGIPFAWPVVDAETLGCLEVSDCFTGSSLFRSTVAFEIPLEPLKCSRLGRLARSMDTEGRDFAGVRERSIFKFLELAVDMLLLQSEHGYFSKAVVYCRVSRRLRIKDLSYSIYERLVSLLQDIKSIAFSGTWVLSVNGSSIGWLVLEVEFDCRPRRTSTIGFDSEVAPCVVVAFELP